MGKIAVAINRIMAKKQGQLSQMWSFDSQSSLLAAPQVADIDQDGHFEVIFGTKGGKIYCLSEEGTLKWKYDITEKFSDVEMMFLDSEAINSIESTPAIVDINGDGHKEILFGSELGIVYCLSAQGNLLWKFKSAGAIKGGISIHDINGDGHPELVFGSTDSYLYVLLSDGRALWRYGASAGIESTPTIVVDANRIIFGDNEGYVNVIGFDGKMQWRYKTGGKIIAKAVVANLDGSRPTIIVGSTDSSLYAIREDGKLLWKYASEGAIIAEVAVADINNDDKLEIVMGSCDNNVHAIRHDGERLWTYETNFWVVSKPIIADIDGDGRLEVVAGSYDHNLYVLDAEGTYMLDHIPGLSGVVPQAGHYADILTSEPGASAGKRLWQFDTEGIIVGCAYVEDIKNIIINTKLGKVKRILHTT